jgi:hypothetical protein
MSTKTSIVKSTGWDAAIKDAQRHIERLRGVIAVCEEKKIAGEPWPGEMAASGNTVTPTDASQPPSQ